jgi:hypothetical protein
MDSNPLEIREMRRQDRLHTIGADSAYKTIALGLGLQHIDRLMQIKLANAQKIAARPSPKPKHRERVGSDDNGRSGGKIDRG